MAEHSFGWIQEAGNYSGLKEVLRAMVPGTARNFRLITKDIPAYVPERFGREALAAAITGENCRHIPYRLLKGRGMTCQLTVEENMSMFGYDADTAEGIVRKGGRGNAACSGIAQLCLTAQKMVPSGIKPYQGDWQAESFVRWGISIGLMDYEAKEDTCAVSDLGLAWIQTKDGSEEEKEILGQAYLSYPPLVRVMSLLEQYGHMTKFEIGSRLGFKGEAGFTSIPQNIFVRDYCMEQSPQEKMKILQNAEGSSDKYARMIGKWLCAIGWAVQEPKTVTEYFAGRSFKMNIQQAYTLTLRGRKHLKRAYGTSSTKRIPKRVMWDMLATKAQDRTYLRNRRTHLLMCLKKPGTLDSLTEAMDAMGFHEALAVIADDLENFKNIGLNIVYTGGKYKLHDDICGLSLPVQHTGASKSDVTALKDHLRKQLTYVDHKYLALIDLSRDSKANRDFEIETMALLINEAGFEGMHLGGASKPDGIYYDGSCGMIVDTKAYAKGYALPVGQADEMIRYIEENKTRGQINANHWWEAFDNNVTCFHYMFVSAEFTGGFEKRLDYIAKRTGICGGALTAKQLLLMAEAVKSGRLDRKESFELFEHNQQVIIPNN